MSDNPLIRCMGGRFCRHAVGTCTATNEEYQAKTIAAPQIEDVVVTQADKEAAAEALGYKSWAILFDIGFPDEHLKGRKIAMLFARHGEARFRAGIEAAAKVADEWQEPSFGGIGQGGNVKHQIAVAIRALTSPAASDDVVSMKEDGRG